MERLTNRTKEAKSNVTIKEVCDKLADFEDLEELIGIPLTELAKIFRQHIPGGCKHPQKAIVLTDGDVDKWRKYKVFEKDGRLLHMPRPGEQEKCRECVHTRASCHHRELKCSECPLTELFCDEFYVAIDKCYEDAYASGSLAGIETGKYEVLRKMHYIVKYLKEEKEYAYADFEVYVNEFSPCLDAEYDDLFHKGLERAIKIVKENIND